MSGFPPSSTDKKNRIILLVLLGLVVFMAGLSYAAVPLYKIFCQVTGYGGTPNVAQSAPGIRASSGRIMQVRFDANIAKELDWSFKPAKPINVLLGEQVLVHYTATSRSDQLTRGTATFNVTPDTAGVYFSKIDCFCFEEQELEAGQSVDMPITFFIDPSIEDDPYLDAVDSITLSYTFYPLDASQD